MFPVCGNLPSINTYEFSIMSVDKKSKSAGQFKGFSFIFNLFHTAEASRNNCCSVRTVPFA